MTAFDGAGAANFSECSCTFAAGPDASRPSKIILQKDIVKKQAWTMFDGLDIHLNGYTLDLKSDANSQLIFPSDTAANISMRDGRLVLIDTSFTVSTTENNSQLDIYNVTLRPAGDLGDATDGFFAPGKIRVLEDSTLAYGEHSVIFDGETTSPTIIIDGATLWQDNLNVSGGGGSLSPNTIDGSIITTVTGAARYAAIGTATSVSLASITDLSSLADATSANSIESFSTTGTTTFATATPALTNDISLRGDNGEDTGSGRFLSFTYTDTSVTLDGNYKTLHFPRGIENVVSLADNVDVVTKTIRLTDVYLGSGSGSHFGLGTNASLVFGTETSITVGYDHGLESTWNVEEYVDIDLQGHTLTHPTFAMTSTGSILRIFNGRLIKPVFTAPDGTAGTVTLKDVEVVIPENTSVTLGATGGDNSGLNFYLDGEVMVTGDGALNITCDITNNKALSVNANAIVTLDRATVNITSADDETNGEVIKIDAKGALKLIGCALNIGSMQTATEGNDSETFSLTAGAVVMDHVNVVTFKHAVSNALSVNVTLGGTTTATELDLVVMPGALLKTSGNGVLNVNQVVEV